MVEGGQEFLCYKEVKTSDSTVFCSPVPEPELEPEAEWKPEPELITPSSDEDFAPEEEDPVWKGKGRGRVLGGKGKGKGAARGRGRIRKTGGRATPPPKGSRAIGKVMEAWLKDAQPLGRRRIQSVIKPKPDQTEKEGEGTAEKEKEGKMESEEGLEERLCPVCSRVFDGFDQYVFEMHVNNCIIVKA